jgi:hemolysin III
LEFREPFSAWTHCASLLLSLPGTLLLWRAGRGDRPKQFGLLAFGLSLAACYAGSTLYHGVRLPERQLAWFETLDFIGIYLLIAGTVTPVALFVLRGRWRWGLLTFVWLLAAVGIGLRLTSAPLSRAVSTGLYLGMGWAAVLAYSELVRALSHRAVRPVLLGGLLYSTGAVLNHVGWPPLWPGAFSAHDLFHLFVMGGSLSHYWFMVKVVAPLERRPDGSAGPGAESLCPEELGTARARVGNGRNEGTCTGARPLPCPEGPPDVRA